MNGQLGPAFSALQALVATTNAHHEESAVNGGAGGSGTELRRQLKADFQKSLRPPAKASQLAAELESQVQRLLAAAPAATAAEPSSAPAQPSKPTVEAVSLGDDDEEDESDDPEPVQERPKPRRILVREEAAATSLRRQVAAGRKTLHDVDVEVTRLTRKLRESRQGAWVKQQSYSAAEARIAKVLAARSSELKKEMFDEAKKLEEEERRLRQALVEARAQATRWYQEARHQDAILQQERDAQKGGDAHRILARHPAGEVFLPAFPSDNDSDDEYYDAPPARRPPSVASTTTAGRSNPRGGEASDSEDSDDHVPHRGPGGAAPANLKTPPDASDSDRDMSDGGSSMVSPANESGSLSGMLEKSGEDHAPVTNPGPLPLPRNPRSDTESSSDGEDITMRAPVAPPAAPATQTASSTSSTPPDTSAPAPTPPAVERRPLRPDVDDVEEISSEDIEAAEEDMESSRSL